MQHNNNYTEQDRVAYEYANAQPNPNDAISKVADYSKAKPQPSKDGETKTSKIVSINPLLNREGEHRSSNGPYGVIYYFTVTMENGDIGSVPSKSNQPKWRVGEEYDYTIKINGNFTNFNNFRKPGTSTFKKQQTITTAGRSNAQVALEMSVSFLSKKLYNGEKVSAEHATALAQKFYEFLQDKN